MQFLILAHDGGDAEAPARRQQVRPEHLARMAKLKASGNFLFGGAILDDRGAMVSSVVVLDFPDRAALDACLAGDPYVTGRVWQQVEVQPFRVAKVD